MNIGRFLKFWRILQNPYSRKLCQSSFKAKWFHPLLVSPLLAVLPSISIVNALSPKEEKLKNAKLQEIIHSADDIYDKADYDELFEMLHEYQESDEPEILWRVARCMFKKSNYTTNHQEKIKLLETALELVTKALTLNEKSGAAHKWRAILLDYVYRHKSTKERIMQSYVTKTHIEKAIEYDPNDSTSYYILGEWCYAFAEMPWYQRRIAAIVFASPPTSTYEEAYSYYQKAEQLNPGFYSKNLVMLGKCLLKQNDKGQAISYLKKACDYPLKTLDDKEAHEEASKLLKELGITN